MQVLLWNPGFKMLFRAHTHCQQTYVWDRLNVAVSLCSLFVSCLSRFWSTVVSANVLRKRWCSWYRAHVLQESGYKKIGWSFSTLLFPEFRLKQRLQSIFVCTLPLLLNRRWETAKMEPCSGRDSEGRRFRSVAWHVAGSPVSTSFNFSFVCQNDMRVVLLEPRLAMGSWRRRMKPFHGEGPSSHAFFQAPAWSLSIKCRSSNLVICKLLIDRLQNCARQFFYHKNPQIFHISF